MSGQSASNDFVISRVFDAPRNLMWQCFSDVKRMQWWGPRGVSIVKATMDFRVGGTYHYGMQTADGQLMWGRQIYREIAPQDRIVFINSFSDEAGGLSRHPLAPNWPLQLLTVFTFEDAPGGKTKLTVRWTPYEATEQEQVVFDAGHASMTGGWSGTFERLEAYLASLQQQQQQ
ncbi:MAG: SRPBCC domain-containing protein [Rhodopseudomonas sp.]|nr:SRPBCC domain-containing protein [Rhodopseudomonas sp.]